MCYYSHMRIIRNNRKYAYVQKYYDENYGNGFVDNEIKAVGKFLIQNTSGKILDCGCGPVPQIWSICMPAATEIHAIDLPIESIQFVKEKLNTVNKWASTFIPYQKIVTDCNVSIQKNYIKKQVRKIRTVIKANMIKLPFAEKYFDTVVSLYSLGVLRNEKELKTSLIEIKRCLKLGGKLLHINTNGHNINNILPEYTWRGLNQTTKKIEEILNELNFKKIQVKTIKLKQTNGMYKYNTIYLLSAIKDN